MHLFVAGWKNRILISKSGSRTERAAESGDPNPSIDGIEKSPSPDDGPVAKPRLDDLQKKDRDLGKPDVAVIRFF